ncbi:TPA: EamA family transporter [Candidatus Dependentiae bacterium]|nr:EamA family transporter [Candidatus Dependentiae bacterium]
MLLIVLLYALFGFTFTLGKVLVYHAAPFFAVGLRMAIGGVLLLFWSWWNRYRRPSCVMPLHSYWIGYLKLTVFAIFIPYVARLWALQELSTGKAALLFNTAPFFSALLGFILLHERLTKLQLWALVLGFLGTVPILLTSSPVEELFSIGIFSLHEIAVIVAAASMSYGFIVMRELVKERGCPPYVANGVATFLGGALALSCSVVFEPSPIKTSFLSLLGVMLLQVIISNLLCSNLQAYLLHTYSPTFMSFAGFLSPLFALIYGFLLFGETVSWHFFASFSVIGVALYIYLLGDRSTKKESLEVEEAVEAGGRLP